MLLSNSFSARDDVCKGQRSKSRAGRGGQTHFHWGVPHPQYSPLEVTNIVYCDVIKKTKQTKNI